MPYKLYTDKQEVFECDVAVKNASLKNSIARLVIESNDLDLVFKGKINDGKCIVPIRKLKGILDENTKGNMSLEVIVEDTYFKPWESEFVVEEHTSIKVAVKEQKEISNKPILEVKIKQPTNVRVQKNSIPAQEIVSICKIFEINSKNFKTTKRNDFKQLVKEYFKEYKEFQKKMNPILNEVVNILR
jgi:hypothetical protein